MLEQQLLRAAQQVEDQIDSELHKMENMDDDDIERLRQKRIDELKRCGALGSAPPPPPPPPSAAAATTRRNLLPRTRLPALQAASEAAGVG